MNTREFCKKFFNNAVTDININSYKEHCLIMAVAAITDSKTEYLFYGGSGWDFRVEGGSHWVVGCRTDYLKNTGSTKSKPLLSELS